MSDIDEGSTSEGTLGRMRRLMGPGARVRVMGLGVMGMDTCGTALRVLLLR